jgi:hypothetical protein
LSAFQKLESSPRPPSDEVRRFQELARGLKESAPNAGRAIQEINRKLGAEGQWKDERKFNQLVEDRIRNSNGNGSGKDKAIQLLKQQGGVHSVLDNAVSLINQLPGEIDADLKAINNKGAVEKVTFETVGLFTPRSAPVPMVSKLRCGLSFLAVVAGAATDFPPLIGGGIMGMINNCT